MNIEDPRTKYKLAIITRLLRASDMDLYQLAEAIPMSTRYTGEYMRHLVNTEQAHIIDWTRRDDHSRFGGVFRIGKGTNLPYPARMTGAQRNAAYRARIKADRERYDRHLRGQRALRRKPPKPDPLLAAMFKQTAMETA